MKEELTNWLKKFKKYPLIAVVRFSCKPYIKMYGYEHFQNLIFVLIVLSTSTNVEILTSIIVSRIYLLFNN